jgi:hypothetical protein
VSYKQLKYLSTAHSRHADINKGFGLSLAPHICGKILIFSPYLSLFLSITLNQHAKPFIENIVVNSNSEYANFTASFTNNKEGDLVLNQTINYGFTFDNVILIYTLAIGKDEHDRNYERVLMKTSINICKALKGKASDFVVKTFMENMQKDFGCPLKKVRNEK